MDTICYAILPEERLIFMYFFFKYRSVSYGMLIALVLYHWGPGNSVEMISVCETSNWAQYCKNTHAVQKEQKSNQKALI